MESFLRSLFAFTLSLLLTLLSGQLAQSSEPATVASSNTITPDCVTTATPAQNGACLYDGGQYEAAISAWGKAVQAYEAQGDHVNQALALSNLSLSQQQLGHWQEAEAAISQSLQLLETSQRKGRGRPQAYAQVLDIQGHLKFAQGQTQEALEIWRQAAKAYTQTDDIQGRMTNRLNQAQALQALGFYLQAKDGLEPLIVSLKNEPNSLLKARSLRSYGDTLRAIGELLCEPETPNQKPSSKEASNQETSSRIKQKPCAQNALKESLAISQALKSSPDISAAQLSLGNTEQAMANRAKGPQECTTDQSEECTAFKASNAKAAELYKEAEDAASQNSVAKIQAQLNRLSLLLGLEFSQSSAKLMCDLNTAKISDRPQLTQEEETTARTLWENAQGQLTHLPDDRTTLYAHIKLAQTLTCLPTTDSSSQLETRQILQDAVEGAKKLNDKRAESYALGNLGHLYEILGGSKQNKHEWTEAQKHTQEALSLAKVLNAPDIVYRWQWQLGRLLAIQSKTEGAIATYTAAIKTLESVRNDLLGISSDIQFTFRDDIEPVYRELLALLLPLNEQNVNEDDLEKKENLKKKAFYYVESLQLAELQNFFQCSLTNFRTIQPKSENEKEDPETKLEDQVEKFIEKEKTAALIYPVILKDHIAILLRLPNKKNLIYHSSEKVDERTVRDTIAEAIGNLKKTQGEDLGDSELKPLVKLYQWLIAPIRNDLEGSGVKNVNSLVFILDGELRKIPMATLYDNIHQKYLVDTQYSLSVVPSIQLLKPSQTEKLPLKALLAGAVQQRGIYDALKEVPNQINLIKKSLDNPSILMDDSTKKTKPFTKKTFREALQSASYNIIHLATHGTFSSNLKNTQLLTDDDTKEPQGYSITLGELGGFLTTSKQPKPNLIDLLVLSACDSASGDNRAILGMAGVAVKFGAAATIAPLWTVDQKSSTLLMDEFYQQLRANPKASKTVVLKMAQNSFRDKYKQLYSAPYHWAPFILVGN